MTPHNRLSSIYRGIQLGLELGRFIILAVVFEILWVLFQVRPRTRQILRNERVHRSSGRLLKAMGFRVRMRSSEYAHFSDALLAARRKTGLAPLIVANH